MKRSVVLVVFCFLAFYQISAFATVKVSVPTSGSVVGSPVQFVASATMSNCSQGVASMGVYIDDHLTRVVNGTSLNVSLSMAPGPHKTVVEEWDYCGGATYTIIPITVSGGQTGVSVTSPKNNSTVTSPVQFVATANTTTCSKGVASMGVYINNHLTYVSNGRSLNTAISLSPATYNAVVEEWDYCGKAAYTPLKITVQGTTAAKGKIAASLSTISFGSAVVGSTATLSETLTNVGQASVTLSSANTSGAAFGRTGITPPLTLTPSESVTFSVFFQADRQRNGKWKPYSRFQWQQSHSLDPAVGYRRSCGDLVGFSSQPQSRECYCRGEQNHAHHLHRGRIQCSDLLRDDFQC